MSSYLHKSIKWIIIVSVFILYHSVNAQTKWNLEQCIEYALKNNIQIKQQSLNLDLAKSNLWQSKMSMLPTINGGATHVYNYGRTVDRFTNQFATSEVQSNNFYLNSNLVIFNGFQLLNTVLQNRLNLQASQFDVEKMKNDISLNVATAYLNVLFAIENYDNAQNQFEISQLQQARTKKMFDAETISKGDYLNIASQVSSEQVQVVNAQNMLDMAYLTLKQMLNLNVAESFEIEKPIITVSPEKYILEKPEQIYSFALGNQPEIKSYDLKLRSAEKGLSISRGGRYPSLTLQGSYGTGYSGASEVMVLPAVLNGFMPIGFTGAGDTVYGPNYEYNYKKKPFNDQISDNLNKSIGFYLNVPIFNGWRTNAEVKRAKINLANSEFSLQLAKDQLNKTIQQAYADANAAYKKHQAGIKSVEAMEESFKYFQQKFDVGMVNSVDYNDAKNKLSKAKSDLLQAKYEFLFKIKIIDFYMGKPLSLK
ncbi:MAG: TolC family protein [Bacteroidota bacterium]